MRGVRVRRVYEPPEPDGGQRILVDRLWPRGLTKEKAALDAWVKDVAPSTGLRNWFGHDPDRWEEFQRRYRQELEAHPGPVQEFIDAVGTGPVTLLYAARDERHNEAVVLQQMLQQRLAERSG